MDRDGRGQQGAETREKCDLGKEIQQKKGRKAADFERNKSVALTLVSINNPQVKGPFLE